MLTNWGYSVDADILPDLLTLKEYEDMTGRQDDPVRVCEEISAASASIRNFVGWHLGPSLACTLSTTFLDRRVTRVGSDVLVQLPARYVSAVASVMVDGTATDAYIPDPSGLLRLINVCGAGRYTPIVVSYSAGLSSGLMSGIKELVAHRVTHAMAVPAGITSEASGGVSVTYNSTWTNNSRATALAADNKELLIPYKVQGVF